MKRPKVKLGMGIVDFFECPWILNINYLSPVQRMVLKAVMGEKLDLNTPIPISHEYQEQAFENEVHMFKYFSGKEDYITSFYSDPDLCLGRRSGKSTTIGAGLALYFATQFNYIPYLRTSPVATIPIISPTKEQAGEVYLAIKNMLMQSPYLYETFLGGKIKGFQEEYSEEDIGNKARLIGGRIQLNNKVVIKVMAADVSKIRGMAVPFAILDEACWFGLERNDNKNTDKGIYEALSPALTQFQIVPGMAMVLKISSPNGQSGLMFDNYENRQDKDILHFQIPTWYANPLVPVSYLEKQKKKGIAFFNREYGAKYTASETSYLDPYLIDECIIKGTEKLNYQSGFRYAAAMDYATKNDYWTLAIGHKEYILTKDKEKKERVFIDLLMHWRGTSGKELDPSVVVPSIARYLKLYKVPNLITDQYAYAPLRTLFQKEGCILKEYAVSHSSKLKFMYSLQIAINSGILKMVHNPMAIKHLKDLREKHSKTSNRIRIEHAQNCHDDYADAIALVTYQFDRSSPIYVGMHEYEEKEPLITKDAKGQYIAYPTAQEVADKVGIGTLFYDNRDEIEDILKRDIKENENEDDDSFWFCV